MDTHELNTAGRRRAAGRWRRAARRFIRARAAFTSRRFRRRSGGTTGSSWTARRGPRGASRSGTCWCRRRASTASPRAACSPTSTGRRSRSASSRATRSTRGRAGGTARRARPPSTRSPIPTGSCTRCGAPASGARGNGSGWAGTRRSGDRRRASASALAEGRPNEVMYHVGRPGEDGFTERVLAAWGVDGHNTHTNVCSSGGRAGYHFWMGADRPSPDHANAEVMLLISSHLEAGHYFNPHAQRVIEAKQRGAKLIVLRHPSVEHGHARRSLGRAAPGVRGRDPARDRELPDPVGPLRPRVRPALVELGGVSGVRARRTGRRRSRRSRRCCAASTPSYTFAFAAAESGVDAAALEDGRRGRSRPPGTRLSTHTWRSAAAGNLGGWQVPRTLFLLNALLGAVATEGGTYPNAWNKFVPAADATCRRTRARGTT